VRWRVLGGRAPARTPAPREAADLAGGNAAAAWRARYLDWIETGLPRSSTDLLARLPFHDAVILAALVGTGRMTWPEVNAALDAMIKLAAAEAFGEQPDEHYTAARTRHAVRQTVEDEIWARYHAQCDEVFANGAAASDMATQAPEQLRGTEQTLNRLRSSRDRALATLRRQANQPFIGLESSQAGMPWTGLSPAQAKALDKLDATGFVGSEGMIAAIAGLASEVPESLGGSA
jgi:hypothetical protein